MKTTSTLRLPPLKWISPLVLLAVISSVFANPSHAAVENRQPSVALHYYIAVNGSFPGFNGAPQNDFIGEVRLFATATAPAGWLPLDGRLLSIIQNQSLFSLLGTNFGGDGRTSFALPNLEGRVPIGSGNGPGLASRIIGTYSGSDSVTLTGSNLPPHTHGTFAGATGSTGSGTEMTNMQPWLALTPIIALQGVYPSDGAGPSATTDPYLGEIKWFAGNFAPAGWAKLDGQLLSIAQNTALFSLIGTTYGGDGQSTFGLPDLRGRAAMHAGQGPGLTNRVWGQEIGTESEALGSGMPSHVHPLPVGGVSSATGSGQSVNNMMPVSGIHYTIYAAGGEIGLFAVTQFALPGTSMDGGAAGYDLRGRLAVGAGTAYALGATFGVETVTVGSSELPVHTHTMPAFIDWMNQYYPGVADLGIVGLDATPGGQFANKLNFVLDADPSEYDPSVLPEFSRNATHAVFVFRRNSDSAAVLDAYVEYGDLVNDWVRAYHGVDGVSIVVDTDGFESGVDRVTVSVPHGGADELFARLVVE